MFSDAEFTDYCIRQYEANRKGHNPMNADMRNYAIAEIRDDAGYLQNTLAFSAVSGVDSALDVVEHAARSLVDFGDVDFYDAEWNDDMHGSIEFTFPTDMSDDFMAMAHGEYVSLNTLESYAPYAASLSDAMPRIRAASLHDIANILPRILESASDDTLGSGYVSWNIDYYETLAEYIDECRARGIDAAESTIIT